MDHQYFFSLSFSKTPTTPSDSHAHIDYLDYMINDGSGTPDFLLNYTPKYSFQFNTTSAFEGVYKDGKASMRIQSSDNYIVATNRFNTDSFTMGAMFNVSAESFESFMNNTHSYLAIITWYNGDDKYELRALDHNGSSDGISVAVAKNDKIIIENPIDYKANVWNRVIYMHDSEKEVLYINGKKVQWLPSAYSISFLDNITIGATDETLHGLYDFYLDDIFICNRTFDMEDFKVTPYNRFIDIYPEYDNGKYEKEVFREKEKEGFAPNYYSDHKSIIDNLTDKMEVTRPVYYHKPMTYKTDEKYKFRFDRETETSASNFIYLDKK